MCCGVMQMVVARVRCSSEQKGPVVWWSGQNRNSGCILCTPKCSRVSQHSGTSLLSKQPGMIQTVWKLVARGGGVRVTGCSLERGNVVCGVGVLLMGDSW